LKQQKLGDLDSIGKGGYESRMETVPDTSHHSGQNLKIDPQVLRATGFTKFNKSPDGMEIDDGNRKSPSIPNWSG
jgi:hypothetical protein